MLNQATIARIEAQIEAHYDHPIRGECSPHSSDSKAKKASYAARMARWNAELDTLTAALRAAKVTPEAAAGRVFPNDITNAEAADRFEFAKQRQLEGVLRSCRGISPPPHQTSNGGKNGPGQIPQRRDRLGRHR